MVRRRDHQAGLLVRNALAEKIGDGPAEGSLALVKPDRVEVGRASSVCAELGTFMLV